jgi:hypothetical protein
MEEPMKNTIALWIIAAGLVAGATGIAQAQYSTPAPQNTAPATTPSDEANAPSGQNDATTTSDTHSNVRTLTGCLQQGENAKEYALMGQDGSTWELKSDSVDLASHVGHTVTVSGAVAHSTMHGMKEDSKKEAQEHGMDKSATEHGHLTVTSLSMVSESCSTK